jgi:hypothetical protein
MRTQIQFTVLSNGWLHSATFQEINNQYISLACWTLINFMLLVDELFKISHHQCTE